MTTPPSAASKTREEALQPISADQASRIDDNVLALVEKLSIDLGLHPLAVSARIAWQATVHSAIRARSTGINDGLNSMKHVIGKGMKAIDES